MQENTYLKFRMREREKKIPNPHLQTGYFSDMKHDLVKQFSNLLSS